MTGRKVFQEISIERLKSAGVRGVKQNHLITYRGSIYSVLDASNTEAIKIRWMTKLAR